MSDKREEFNELPIENEEQLDFIDEPYNKDAYPLVLVHDYLVQHYDFRSNKVSLETEFKRKDEDKYRFFDDTAYRDLDQEIRMKVAKVDERYLKNWIFGSKISKEFDPIKEYLFSLPKWDEKIDYLRLFLKQVVLDRESDRDLFVRAFKKWFVAMVASFVDDHIVNHTCFVLVGAQGRYKTTLLNNLVPKEYKLDYLYSSTFITHNKDHEKYLFTKWLINLDEMQAFNRQDIESVKSKMSQDKVIIRLPYAKTDTKAWRRASFCGSVNKDKFLNDATGTRRFLPFKIEDINLDETIDIGKLYAQGLALFKSGFKFYFDREDIEELERNNDKYKDKQFEEELLMKHFVAPSEEQLQNKDKSIQYLNATDIMQWLFKKYENYNKNNTVRRNIGVTMQANGFIQVKKRINNTVTSVYPVIIVDNPTMTNEDGSVMTENIPEFLI